ncbi:alanine--tRNA ligase-related protein [Staphylococcus aureus]
MIYNGEEVSQVEAGETVYFMLTETPFYAVSGGQVADTGIVYNGNFEIAVSEVTKAPNSETLHQG